MDTERLPAKAVAFVVMAFLFVAGVHLWWQQGEGSTGTEDPELDETAVTESDAELILGRSGGQGTTAAEREATMNEHLQRLRDSSSAEERRSAALRLQFLADETAEPTLLEALKSEDEVVARRCAETLLALWRQSTSAAVNRLMGKATSAYEDGDYDSAMDKFDMCRRLDPSVPELHRLRGEILLSHANVRQAMSACDRAIELKPHNFMAHYLRARIHMRQSNFEPALEAARDVLDIYPNHSAAAELESEILALQEATED